MKNKEEIFNATRIIAVGFALAIILATFVLMLPISSASGEWTSIVDSMFTATTSVCVTGLVVVPTYVHWSLFGKVVILSLIQLGGLGVVCIVMGLLIITKRQITIKQRKIIRDSYNLSDVGGMVLLIRRVFGTTFVIEGIGAILFSIRFIPKYGVIKGIGYSIFHAISAFCNAGIDLLGPDSLMPYYNDALINLTAMFLIISGGIGFIVWWDVIGILKDIKSHKITKNKIFIRLSLHSKLAIVVTAIMIVVGAVIIFAFEYNNNSTIGGMPLHEKMLVSVFESVTLRTAGFATISQAGFKGATLFLICAFMFIGGSPMGTAGGVKTITISVLFLEIISVVRGKNSPEVFKRKIDNENVRTAISVVIISFICAIVAIMALSFTENAPLRVVVFEVFSAIGTVGLSMDYTASLSLVGKAIVIGLMYLGRIGPITMAMAFAARSSKSVESGYPEKKIIIG